jgi:hypothetical protein
MAISYPDRRSRYSGILPWEAARTVSSTPAVRGVPPRDNFRVVTADAPDLNLSEWTQQLNGTWAKKPLEPSKADSGSQTPASSPASSDEPAIATASASRALPKADIALSAASSSEM